MSGFLEELLFVLSHSTRTTIAVVLALVFPVLILILGDAMTPAPVSTPSDPLQPLVQNALHLFYFRYLAAASGAFCAFMGVAFRSYKRDRRRLLYL